MTYDPNTMPATIDEWNELIAYKTNESLAAYNTAVAGAEAQALAAYAQLPASGDKPTQADYVAQAISLVPLPAGSGEWEQTFRAAGYYPQGQPLFVEPEPTAEEKRAQELAAIDAATSRAILAGFDYELDGQLLHFSYDRDDQQNFADTANACLLKQAGAAGLPEYITWNAYAQDGSLVRVQLAAEAFLALYAQGALAHKQACMEAGGAAKAALAWQA